MDKYLLSFISLLHAIDEKVHLKRGNDSKIDKELLLVSSMKNNYCSKNIAKTAKKFAYFRNSL